MRHFHHCKIQLEFAPLSNMQEIHNNIASDEKDEVSVHDPNKKDNDTNENDVNDEKEDNDEDEEDDYDEEDEDNDEDDFDEDSTDEENLYITGKSPFVQYYDFSKHRNEERSLWVFEDKNQKQVAEINDNDEVVLNDGTIIGHRSLHFVYKQRHNKHETQTEEQLISQVNNPNKKFILEQMIKTQDRKAFEESGMKEGNILFKQAKDDSIISFQARRHKLTGTGYKNQNRMLY